MSFALLHSAAQCTGPKVLGVLVHMSIGHVHQCSFTRPFSLHLNLGFPWKWKSLSHVPLFALPWIVYPGRLLHAWNSPGKSTGVGCHFLLQMIFPIQGSNPGLLHCRQILSQLSNYSTVIAEHLDFLHVTQLAFLFHHIFQKIFEFTFTDVFFPFTDMFLCTYSSTGFFLLQLVHFYG